MARYLQPLLILMNDVATEITLRVTSVLEDLGVPYLIGGSLASTVHGELRGTLDSDLVADLLPQHAPLLALRLRDEFYVSLDAMFEAIQHRTSFNLIHLATAFKVDIFIPKQRPFDQFQFANRTLLTIATDPERTAYVASAEDTILAKLEWFRLGDEVSDRQWRDVVGVIKVQGDRLDLTYLRQRAAELAVADLLEKALAAGAQP